MLGQKGQPKQDLITGRTNDNICFTSGTIELTKKIEDLAKKKVVTGAANSIKQRRQKNA